MQAFSSKFEADDEERGSVYKYMTDRRRNPTKKLPKSEARKVFLKRRRSVNTVISPKAKENRQKPFKASESKQRITSFRK